MSNRNFATILYDDVKSCRTTARFKASFVMSLLGGASKECVHAKTAKTALIEHSLLHTYITYILEAFFSFTLQVLPVCNACNLSCFFACLQTEKKKRVS